MKIVAIRGKNLASLEGEFEIDFTAEPLRSAGIFAITGSTGAGKSTLLDALCLALFDSTPRMNKAKENNVSVMDVQDKMIAQNDSRSILRRGTAEGYSEVDFVALTGEIYRSRWMVRRSRGKVEGSLQKVEMSLFNLTSGREEQGTKTELLVRITGLIGLSFEQFSRSVLLAQGDFATFLKARQSEKAEILEKLTGTEIYSRISASIYEKTKKAETEFKLVQERIKGIELLADEQLQELAAERELHASQLSIQKKTEESLTLKLKWIEEERQLSQTCVQAEEALIGIRREIEEAKPRNELLAQIEQAQEVRDVFIELRHAQHQAAENQKRLEEQQAGKQKNEAALALTGKQLAVSQQALQEFKAYLLQIEPQLAKAKELDIQLIENKKQVAEVQKEVAAVLQNKNKSAQTVTALEENIRQLQNQQQTVQVWFERYAAYAQLVPAIELVTSLLTNWEAANAQKLSNDTLLYKVKQMCETEEQRLKALQQESERLNRLLPTEIVLLRAQLKEGEPCPVCGSVHHPQGKLTDVQSLQEEELNQAKEKVAKETEQLTATLNSRHLEITRLMTLIESYAGQSSESLANATAYVSILPNWQELLAKGTLKRHVQEFGRLWNTHLQEQANLKEALAARTAQLESAKNEVVTSGKTYEEKRLKAETQQAELTAREQERHTLLNGEPTEKVLSRNATRQKELEKEVETVQTRHHALSVEAESFRVRILQLESDITRLTDTSEADKKRIDEWLSAQPEKKEFAYLEALLSKDRSWINAEKQFINTLKERETSTLAVQQERKQKLAEHRSIPSKPDAEESHELLINALAACTAEKETLSNRLVQIEMTIGNHWKGKQKIASFEKELIAKTTTYENWSKLNELFGSQTGTKFKEIAQGYTLDVLLLYANKHLQDLAPRYELQRVPDTLALQIIDLDMMGEVRSVHSLSGGESFLVSLALALGLSSLSSNRMNVESLFIDEGFGSLDIDTLRIAMDALERLQMQGRKIGVISHVEEMTERIPTRIQVMKISNGKSCIRVV